MARVVLAPDPMDDRNRRRPLYVGAALGGSFPVDTINRPPLTSDIDIKLKQKMKN